MSLELVGLAALMALVTYPARALPLLAPGMSRLPADVLRFLRLVGPATLASLAAVYALSVTTPDGSQRLVLGVEGLAVVVTIVLVRWRGALLPAILAAVVLVAVARAIGIA